MGIINRVFGTNKEERRARERQRYDDLLKKGYKPSEAVATLDRERNEQSKRQPANSPKYQKQYPQKKPKPVGKGGIKQAVVKTIAMGGTIAENIKQSGFLGDFNNSGGRQSIMKKTSNDSFLDFSRVRNDSIFGNQRNTKTKRRKKNKKTKKNRQIVINL